MKPFDALVITSIAPPTAVLRRYAAACQHYGIHFILIGDTKSPPDFQLDGCEFYSIERQRGLPFHLAHLLPERHYARKNIGYLVALAHGAHVIAETDDDNLPLETFWHKPTRTLSASVAAGTGWTNVFRYFTSTPLWPRGFPLQYVHAPVAPREELPFRSIACPVQQGLADENPDVDAIYRMTRHLPVLFDAGEPVALGRGAWCPFNTQNTVWFRDAAALMYLPSYCSFRMTDIWRSFVAQRVCWEYDWHVLFTQPTVRQERNEHNLLRDFEEEVPGYLHNDALCAMLAGLSLNNDLKHCGENMRTCYKNLVEMRLIQPDELLLLEAWLQDLQALI